MFCWVEEHRYRNTSHRTQGKATSEQWRSRAGLFGPLRLCVENLRLTGDLRAWGPTTKLQVDTCHHCDRQRDAANGRMLFCPPFSTFSFCFRQLVVYGYSVMVCPDSRFSRLCTEFLRLFGGDSFVTKVSRVCVRIPCWQRLCFLYNGCPYAHTLTLSTSHTHTHTHTLLTESVSE